MSKFILNEKTDKGFQDGFINDVTFVYVCIQEAKSKFGKKNEFEYSVGLVVDEDTYDIFADKYPKNVSNKSVIKTEDFKERYGIDPVYPNEKKQYVIQLKAPHTDNKGVEIAYEAFKRPKVYVPSGEGRVSDITMDKLVANGSKGHINFWVSHSDEFGDFPKLKDILVTELIVFVRQASTQSAFGKIDNSSAPETAFDKQEKEDAPDLSDFDNDTPF